MLGKLIKHEFIATWRTYCILFAVILMLALMLKITGNVLVIVLYAIALMSSFVIVLIFTVRRYYRHLLSNQAYLTLMLPATSHHHLIAKIIATATWYAGLVLSIFVSLLIIFGADLMVGFEVITEALDIFTDMNAAETGIGMSGGLLLFHLFFMMLLNALYYLMSLYFCTTIGGQSGNNKVIIGIALFIGINMGFNLISSLFMGANVFELAAEEFTAENFGAMMNRMFISTEVLSAAAAVGFYFLTARRLTHNFNLQ